MSARFDEYIGLLGEIRDSLKKAQVAMSIPRPDRAKLILLPILEKMDRLWELETSDTKNS